VLDSGEVRRVGEERAFHVDARILAATNKDLSREAAEGRFRWDLFYRVSTISVPVPSLRQRRADIPLLVQHFTGPATRGKSLKFAAEAMDRLMSYSWPGNIRELRNLVERLMILHEGDEVRVNDLPAELGVPARAAPEPEAALVSLQEIERRHVERVLQATGWNKAQAARVLDVDIKTLNKKIRDYGLSRSA
jgi:DNA-binding NtrC family response regulator